jgi:hypothetical protein
MRGSTVKQEENAVCFRFSVRAWAAISSGVFADWQRRRVMLGAPEVGFSLICFDCAPTGRNYLQPFRTIFLARGLNYAGSLRAYRPTLPKYRSSQSKHGFYQQRALLGYVVRSFQDCVAFVCRGRTDHLEHAILGIVDRQCVIVAAVDHEDGLLHAQGKYLFGKLFAEPYTPQQVVEAGVGPQWIQAWIDL